MRKLFAIAMALGLLLSLVACGTPQEEELTSSEPETITKTTTLQSTAETTTETAVTLSPEEESEYNIRRTREVNAEIEEQFQLLIDRKGIVQDEDVRDFANELYRTCYHLYFDYQAKECHPFLMPFPDSGYLPNYQAVASALKGKISPGAARWLALKAESHDFEPANIIISPDLEPWGGRASDGWISGYLNPGSFFPFTEEFATEYDARQKASMEEFLGNKANTKYPFYEEIQEVYNERFK